MEKVKIVRKSVPVSLYDIAGYESWLGEMAEKGLFLKEFGAFFAHFTREEPQQITYRIEPVPGGEFLGQEIHRAYIQAGWKYVTCIKDTLSIYRIESSKAEEVHIDLMEEYQAFRVLEQKLRGSMILVILGAILIVGMLIGLYLFHDEPVLYMITYGGFSSQFLYILLEIFIVTRSALDLKYVRGYVRQLKSGKPLCHQKNYKSSRNWQLVSYGLIIVLFIIGIVISYGEINSEWEKPREEVEITLPVISLQELEGAGGFAYQEAVVSPQGRYYENTVTYQWNVLAPRQYEIDECGIVEGEKWEDGSGVYEPSLRSQYYEVAFKQLSEPLLNDLIHRYAYRYEELETEELETELFDRAVIAAENESQYLFAYKGRKIIFLSYYGKIELKSKLQAIAEVLN